QRSCGSCFDFRAATWVKVLHCRLKRREKPARWPFPPVDRNFGPASHPLSQWLLKSYNFGTIRRPRAPRHQAHRLRHRGPDRACRAAGCGAERGRAGRARRAGDAHRRQGAHAAGPGRPGGRLPRRRWRLPAGARRRAGHPGRDRRGDGRPAGHDRVRPARGRVRHRAVLRRARQLAPDQRRGGRGPARRHPGADAGAAPGAPAAPPRQGRPAGRARLTQPEPPMGTAVEQTPTGNAEILQQLGRRYDAGFITDIEADSLPPGLSEDIVRALSATKGEPEWMTQWRLAAYRHWLTMPAPHWAKLKIGPIDFQAISYYAAPKGPKYKSLDEVPKELIET